MIRVHILSGGKLTTLLGAGAVTTPGSGTHVWVEAVAPDKTECAALVGLLGIHELSVEDALVEGHPPKLEEFEDHLFIIAHTPVGMHETRKVAIFLGKAWIVTLERTEISALDEVTRRVEREPARFLASPDRLMHALLDYMTDGFEHRTDDLIDRAERMEEAALEEPAPQILEAILDLRKQVAGFTRIVRAQRDVCAALLRVSNPAIPKKLQPYLRDVYDHVLRVYDLLEAVREQVGAARDAHLVNTSNRLSDIMRTLTVLSTIFMPLTLLSGIWGMNVEGLPGSRHPVGFWSVLGLMALVGFGLVWWFRRRGWLR